MNDSRRAEPAMTAVRRAVATHYSQRHNSSRYHLRERLHREGALSFSPRAVGSWWARDGTQQIDVVALGADQVLLGECKWTNEAIDEGTLGVLRQKSLHFQQDGNVRSLHLKHVDLAIFSRSGFTARLRAQAGIEGIRLFDLTDIG